MLDLWEANLMMVGSNVQETLCTRHVLSESVISSPGEVQAAAIPIQQTWTLRLREVRHPAQALKPSSVVWTGLIRAWTLNHGAVHLLSSRGPRVHHGIPDGASGGSSLPLPLGHLDEPLFGSPGPRGLAFLVPLLLPAH